VFRTFLFQPSIVNRIGKKLNFEDSDINRAPVQVGDSFRKVASAKRTPPNEDGPAALCDPLGIISAGPDVIFIVQCDRSSRTINVMKWPANVSGEVEGSVPQDYVSDTASLVGNGLSFFRAEDTTRRNRLVPIRPAPDTTSPISTAYDQCGSR
jgi:hypothetical protein